MTDTGLVGAPPLGTATRARVAVPFLVVTLIWSSTWLVIRDQLGVVPPAWSVTYRFALAGTAMLIYARITGARLTLSRREHGIAAVIGLAQFVLNFNLVYRAESHVTSGLVAVLFALLVVPNAILGRVFLGTSLSRPFVVGSAVALVGIALLFRHELVAGHGGGRDAALGIALALAAVVSASVANVLQATPPARRMPIAAMLAWAMLWGALLDMAFAWTTAGPPVVEWRAGYWLGIAWLGLAGSAISFPLYFSVIRAIGPARAAYSSVLVPVIAMALSTVFEGYRWTVEAAAGGLLVLAGLLVALTARQARSPARQSG